MEGGAPPTADDRAAARIEADAVARRSYGKLVAFLAARSRDVAAAEDALSAAFAAALEDWPVNGCPANPEGWLMTTARRKLTDAARRRKSGDAVAEELRILAEELGEMSDAAIPDQRLALMFAAAHPSLDPGIRTPLMLQAVLGLNAKTIASAFLTSPAAMAKRLVRAKEKIREAGIPFAIPDREVLPERLDAVLDAIYAGYSEGWIDPSGADAARHDLTQEAIFLARIVTELMPEEPEALGLLALMLHAEARRPARRTANGDYVPLSQQDCSLWNRPMIDAAEVLLHRAAALRRIGRFQLEAAIQSAHCDRRRYGAANWPAVLRLYDALLVLSGSPVVAINRSLALAEIEGPEAALAALDTLASDVRLSSYQPYWATRAELLARCGRSDEASRAFDLAIGLEADPAVRRFLIRRRAGLLPGLRH